MTAGATSYCKFDLEVSRVPHEERGSGNGNDNGTGRGQNSQNAGPVQGNCVQRIQRTNYKPAPYQAGPSSLIWCRFVVGALDSMLSHTLACMPACYMHHTHNHHFEQQQQSSQSTTLNAIAIRQAVLMQTGQYTED